MDFKFIIFINRKNVEENMDKLIKGLIIGIIIGLVFGGGAGYLFHNNISRNFIQNKNNFQIDENTKNKIISFFDNTTDINSINSYCNQNMNYCLYYCRTINPNHEICANLINNSMRQRGKLQQ